MSWELSQENYQELCRTWRSSATSTEAHAKLLASPTFPNELRPIQRWRGPLEARPMTLQRVQAIVEALRYWQSVPLPRLYAHTNPSHRHRHLDFSKM